LALDFDTKAARDIEAGRIKRIIDRDWPIMSGAGLEIHRRAETGRLRADAATPITGGLHAR
jgi:hypothetical protein